MLLPNLIHFVFQAYTLMIVLRIISSWIPELNQYSFMRYVYEYTDPYLNFFRQLIPPLGMFDLSPIVALFSLHFLERLIISLLFL